MKRLRLYLPALAAGLLAGWLLSLLLRPARPAEKAAPLPAGSASAAAPAPLKGNAAFRALVDQRAPHPDAAEASKLLLFWDSRALRHSPVRAGLEAEVLRHILPVEQVTGNEFLDVRPEGTPGEDQLMARLAQKNPRYALAEVGRMLSGGRKTQSDADSLRRTIFREWLKSDPRAALAAALKEESALQRGQVLTALMSEWSALDPAAAAAALPSLPDIGGAYGRKSYAEILLGAWHERDPAAAQAWAKSQSDPALRESLASLAAELAASSPAAKTALLLDTPQRDLSRLTESFSEWLSAEPDAAVAKLAAIPAGDKFWEHEAGTVASRWAMHARMTESTEDLQKVLESMPAGPQRDAVLEGFVNYGASNDIPFAQQMLAQMGEGRPRNEAAGMLTELWMRKDPVALSDWLASQPQTDSRHHAVTRFAQLLSKSDPERAAHWVDTVPDGFAFKDSTVQTIQEAWQASDPAAAAAWKTGAAGGE
jgi:hypothetical protein